MSRARCRDVTLPSGETIRVRGDKPMTEADIAALSDVIDAVKRRVEAEPPELREARAERQRAALERLHGRPLTRGRGSPVASEGAS